MTNTAYPRVPEHLIQAMRDECQARWGYTPDEDHAIIMAVKRDRDRVASDLDAGRTPEASEIDYGFDQPYAGNDRIWAPDPDSR